MRLARALRSELWLRWLASTFRREIIAPPTGWMLDQVRADFAPLRKAGLTSAKLDAFWRARPQSEALLRVTITNGTIGWRGSVPERLHARRDAVRNAVTVVHRVARLPDLDCIISLHDSSATEPVLTFAKPRSAPSVLIPDFEALGGHLALIAEVDAAARRIPWEDKLDQACWRGASTGGFSTADSVERLPRAALVLLSLANPLEIDARFTFLCQMDEAARQMLTSRGALGGRLTPTEQLRHRYLIDVDGNSCSYSRCYWGLLGNSVLLKQVTDETQWYYGSLRPYQHFIPVKRDLSDLLAQLAWARAHDDECRKISRQASDFARTELSFGRTLQYLRLVLSECAAILQTAR
jgi:hypothetical protein